MGTRAEDEYRRKVHERHNAQHAAMLMEMFRANEAKLAAKRRKHLRALFRRHRYRGF